MGKSAIIHLVFYSAVETASPPVTVSVEEHSVVTAAAVPFVEAAPAVPSEAVVKSALFAADSPELEAEDSPEELPGRCQPLGLAEQREPPALDLPAVYFVAL